MSRASWRAGFAPLLVVAACGSSDGSRPTYPVLRPVATSSAPKDAGIAPPDVVVPDAAPPDAAGKGRDATIPVDASRTVVTLYGQEGTFGQLAGATATPSGHSFRAVAVPGWGPRPGQAPYFTAVASDGTVVIANSTQTDNQVEPTAPDMVLSLFHPDVPSFENLVVPTSRGGTTAVSPASGSAMVGGADIADLELLSVAGEERVAFISASPYDFWSIRDTGLYPTLGFLSRATSGAWTYDAARSLTADDVAARSTNGARACPASMNLMGESFHDCKLPAEMALLPASGAFAVTLYASPDDRHSGRLMVVRPDGVVLALLQYPEIRDADGTVLDVLPREVDADPTSTLGDERFAVVFDVLEGGVQSAFPLQEFRFDGSTIRPVSAPILTGDRNGDTVVRFETARYDHAGNLWAAQNEVGTLTGGDLAVYVKRGGTRSLERSCAAGADPGASWGTTCEPDVRIAATSMAGSIRSFSEDPLTGTMLLGTLSGELVIVHARDQDGGIAFDSPKPVELGLGQLLDRTRYLVGVRKASVDVKRRALYLPAMQLENAATCAKYPCSPRSLAGWLYRLDLDSL